MFSKLIRYCTFRDNFFTLSFDYHYCPLKNGRG